MSNISSDKFPEQAATHRAVWEWGETQHVCAEEIPLLQQQAVNLGRRVDFHPIAATETPALERPERTSLKAQIYALEEENVDLRAKAASLYNEVGTLRADNRLLILKSAAADTAVKSAQESEKKAVAELARVTRELGISREEASTLHSLVGDVEANATALIEARKEIEELKGQLAASAKPAEA